MRKIILFLSLSFFALISNAQFKKGTISPNFDIGNLKSFSMTNNSNEKKYFVSFNPGVGYFAKNNLEVGIGINFSSFDYTDKRPGIGWGQENTKSIGFRVYSNFYFGKGKLKPYLSLQAGLNHYSGYYTVGGIRQNLNRWSPYIAPGAGINWNIKPGLSVFAEGRFHSSDIFKSYNHTDFVPTIGMRIFLNRKKK